MDHISPEAAKVILDIGLGALSLLLWFGQGRVNRQQAELDRRQSKMTEDLTVLVQDHDERITRLERRVRAPSRKPKRVK